MLEAFEGLRPVRVMNPIGKKLTRLDLHDEAQRQRG